RDAGNTVVGIEHNLDVIKTAGWVIDLGPEGSDAGSRVVAQGTPEDVAGTDASFTGRYLPTALAGQAERGTQPRSLPCVDPSPASVGAAGSMISSSCSLESSFFSSTSS